MKIEYGDEVLGEDWSAPGAINDRGGDHSRVVQQEPLAGGTALFTAAKGNRGNQRSFIVEKVHADEIAALKWWETHFDQLPDSAALRISHGNYAAQMSDAVLAFGARLERNGKTTLMSYTFTGGKIVDAV